MYKGYSKVRLKKWGKPHLNHHSSRRTLCGLEVIKNQKMEPRRDRPQMCADCRKNWKRKQKEKNNAS